MFSWLLLRLNFDEQEVWMSLLINEFFKKKKKIIRNFYCSHGDRTAAKVNLLVYNLSVERQTSVDLF